MSDSNDACHEQSVKIGEVIETMLGESGLSISAFARKVGYSRPYIYELLKTKDVDSVRKMPLDTLKRICDATGYNLTYLLVELGYLSGSQVDVIPHSVIVVNGDGTRSIYQVGEENAALIEDVSKALIKNERNETDRH